MENGFHYLQASEEVLDEIFEKDKIIKFAYNRGYFEVRIQRADQTRFVVFSRNEGCAEAVSREINSKYDNAKCEFLNRSFCAFEKNIIQETDDIKHFLYVNDEDNPYRYSFRCRSDAENFVYVDVFCIGNVEFSFTNNEEIIQNIIENSLKILVN